MGRDVRVGVLGLRRGAALARLARQAGMRVVAVCERDDRRREEVAGALDAAAYRDLEPFLAHPMDGVILVNDFDQHAPVATRALERGLSVLSETAACRTLAEGVALVEAAERSAGVYMFAENYPYMPFTRRCAAAMRPVTSARSATPRPSTWTSRLTWPRWWPTGATGGPAPRPPTTAPTPWPRWPRSPAPGRWR